MSGSKRKDWFDLSNEEVVARMDWWKGIEDLCKRTDQQVTDGLTELMENPRYEDLKSQTHALLLRTRAARAAPEEEEAEPHPEPEPRPEPEPHPVRKAPKVRAPKGAKSKSKRKKLEESSEEKE